MHFPSTSLPIIPRHYDPFSLDVLSSLSHRINGLSLAFYILDWPEVHIPRFQDLIELKIEVIGDMSRPATGREQFFDAIRSASRLKQLILLGTIWDDFSSDLFMPPESSIIELPQLEELTIADIAIGDIISILLTVRCPNLKRLGYGALSPPWVLDDFYEEAVTAWNSAPMLDYPLLEHLDIWQLTRNMDFLPIRKLPPNVIHLGLGANTGAKDRVFELKKLLRLVQGGTRGVG
ncbi:hypothetical protein FRC03_004776 [Tulasnella sp. 419]|nr:hypothetical protein FRC03_004776 [Tulasnella sp. 419]